MCARKNAVVGGIVIALWALSASASAFESAPGAPATNGAGSSLLPQFLDSSRLPDLEEAWRRGTVTEDYTDKTVVAPLPPDGAAPQGQVVRNRAEELSGRFSVGATNRDATASGSSATPLPGDLSEAAMPAGDQSISHVGAPLATQGTVDTTATLPDVTAPLQDQAPAAAPANATWLRHGIPPLPLRKSAKLKSSTRAAKAAKAKASEAADKDDPKAEELPEKKIEKAKAKTAVNDDAPVKHYRPTAAQTPPQLHPDPARREVFPPYLGAYGMNK